MGGKGAARGLGRVAEVDGTWQSLYVNCFNKTHIKTRYEYIRCCLIVSLHTAKVLNSQQE